MREKTNKTRMIKSQAGFRSGTSTSVILFTLQILKKVIKGKQQTSIIVIDYSKAVDSANYTQLVDKMKDMVSHCVFVHFYSLCTMINRLPSV